MVELIGIIICSILLFLLLNKYTNGILWRKLSKRTKSLSKPALIIYLGCIVTIVLLNYGVLFIFGNILFFGLTTWFLMGIKKAKPLKSEFLDEINPKVLIIVSIMGIGTICGLYSLYQFYKYPIKIGMTDEDMINQEIAEKRERKLRRLGLK